MAAHRFTGSFQTHAPFHVSIASRVRQARRRRAETRPTPLDMPGYGEAGAHGRHVRTPRKQIGPVCRKTGTTRSDVPCRDVNAFRKHARLRQKRFRHAPAAHVESFETPAAPMHCANGHFCVLPFPCIQAVASVVEYSHGNRSAGACTGVKPVNAPLQRLHGKGGHMDIAHHSKSRPWRRPTMFHAIVVAASSCLQSSNSPHSPLMWPTRTTLRSFCLAADSAWPEQKVSAHIVATLIPAEGFTMKNTIKRFWQEEDGITALEYGILAAIILVAVAGFAMYISGQFGSGGDMRGSVDNAINATKDQEVPSP